MSTGADNAMMEDDDDDKEEGSANEVEIAVKTASIFRGIKVDARTGEILEQNARASRSQKKNGGGGGKKAGEKSRQVAKIDKAQDLVDEDGDGGIVSCVFYITARNCFFGSLPRCYTTHASHIQSI